MTTHILSACLAHETHGFLNQTTPADHFKIPSGLNPEDGVHRGSGTSMDGFWHVAETEGWKITQAGHFVTSPSATAEHSIVEEYVTSIEDLMRQHEEGLDGIFMFMHGAMLSLESDDVEGLVLRRVQELSERMGLDIPIVCALDLHGNISEAIIGNSDYVHAFRKNPHTDVCEVGRYAGRCMKRILEHGTHPAQRLFRLPLIMPPSCSATNASPMCDALALARSLEQVHPEFLAQLRQV